jgi:hypothetical protein
MAAQPAIRIDAVTILAAGLSAILIIGTGKVLALRFHQHPIAQGYNVLF